MMPTSPPPRPPMDTIHWVGLPFPRPLATVAVFSPWNCFRLGRNMTLLLFRLLSTDTTYWMALPLLPLLATAVLFP